MEHEEWRDVVGYEGLYQVSNLGRVKSLGRYVNNHSGTRYFVQERYKTPSERRQKGKEHGYLAVKLYKNNICQNAYVHRLVADAFIANPDMKATVNHINGDKHDNRACNLEWCTYSENNVHAIKAGLNDSAHRRNRKGSVPVSQYDADMNLIKTYPSMREAERQTGIDCTSISLGAKKGWKYGGFIWRLAE